MQLYILDTNYKILGMIDESESVLWNKKYNDVGECEIYIPCNTEYLAMLRRGNYVYRFDDDMFCKIERVGIDTDVENGDYIVATATDIFVILAGRIVRWQVAFSGTVGQFIKKVLTDNAITPAQEQTHRKIPKLVFDDSNISEFSEKIETTAFTNDLSQVIVTTCKTYNIGFRVSYDMQADTLVFRLYRGKNKASTTGGEYIEFSPAFANILNSKYSEDDSGYKNVVYVGYKSANKDDDTVYLYSYPDGEYTIAGEARREVYVDATGASRDITLEELQAMFPGATKVGDGYVATIDGEQVAVALSDTSGENEKITVTDYTYMLLIRAVAANALAERTRKQIFEGVADTIKTYQYKTDYDLGDIVKVKDDYGNESEAQITEVMESDDSENGYEVEPKFEHLN